MRPLAVPLLLTLALAGPGALAEDSARLLLVDDQGREITAPLEICFPKDLKEECAAATDGAALLPEAVQTFRVEGPDHGPVSADRAKLQEDPSGRLRLIVPRKALLRIKPLPREALTLSLYDPRDPAFRTPAFRVRVPETGEVKVPAGDFIASLSSGRRSPDLQRLSTKPAAKASLPYRAREGWAMVLRCREAGANRVKAGVAVAVKKAEGYGRPEVLLEEARTAPDGIALVSGLRPAMAAVTVQHPDAVTRTVHGLTATPGTFAFREIELEKGGTLRARVSLGGVPVVGAACRLLSFEENPNGPSEARTLYEGRSDKAGFCRTGPIAPGPYTLRLTPPESRSFTDRLAIVEAGKETEVEVALNGIRLTGRITRDDKPAAGFQVIVMDLERPERYRSPGPVAEAVANEEGEYETTLWAAGEYLIRPASPQGTPAAARKVLTLERSEEVVDFELRPQGFAGRVVDEDGQPVADASAVLRWKGGMLLAKSDPEGRFEIAVQDEGEGTLYAVKPGYRDSEKAEVAVPSPASGVLLVLSRSGAIRGTVLSAAGAPVSGALVAVTARVAGPDAFSQVRSARADASGRFELDRVPGSPLRVFVSGPGCPLSSSTLADGPEDVTLRCADMPAALEITFKDDQGQPIPRAAVLLRQRGEVVPSSILAGHLAALGVPAEADGSGRLTLAGLAPGDYDLFLASESSEGTLQAGLPNGYLTSATLYPLTTSELEITPAKSY